MSETYSVRVSEKPGRLADVGMPVPDELIEAERVLWSIYRDLLYAIKEGWESSAIVWTRDLVRTARRLEALKSEYARAVVGK
jgi:hypothetical protein